MLANRRRRERIKRRFPPHGRYYTARVVAERLANTVAKRLLGKRRVMPLDGWEWDEALNRWKSEVINGN